MARLNELLEYVRKIGELNQKTIFRLEEYKKPLIYEDTLKNKKGIYFNLPNNENSEPIWLKIDRLKRTEPPLIDEELKQWIIITKDPSQTPKIQTKIIKTITELEVIKLLQNKTILESDIKDCIKDNDTNLKLKDVFFRLENQPEIEEKVNNYVQNNWYKWQQKELPVRETIKIYEQFFNLHNTIHNGSDKEQVELIWGTGIVKWNCKEHLMNFPIIDKSIDIKINNIDGSIEITPRVIEHNIQVNPFLQLENKGVDKVVQFAKDFYSPTKDLLFSPYESETFEEVLRQSVTHLDSNGSYYPNINNDIDNRSVPKTTKELVITDTWVIYLRPRETTRLIQDIKNFQDILLDIEDTNIINSPIMKIVQEPSNTMTELSPIINDNIFSNNQNTNNKEEKELFFPKPYNEAQEQIIHKLDNNNGVIVQGPPGTGKTHTIANIICHYLATGKKILVTSEHEPALSVIQEQLPEEIRKLTISILTDERQGNKQLEQAINLLQKLMTQSNDKLLKNQKKSLEESIKKLKNEISKLEAEIRDWSHKQLEPISNKISNSDLELTAMDLAKEIMNDIDIHNWFEDEIGVDDKFIPSFTNDEISKLKAIRQKIGTDIQYVDEEIFNKNDLLDISQLIAIHNDIIHSTNIEEQFKIDKIPLITQSINNVIDNAEELILAIKNIIKIHNIITTNQWLKELYINNENEDNILLFKQLEELLIHIVDDRKDFVQNLVEITDPTDLYVDTIFEYLNILSKGENPFGFFTFGKKHEKNIIENIKVNGENPKSQKDWILVLKYLTYQYNIKKFLIKWNHIGQELKLPIINFQFGILYPELVEINTNIQKVKNSKDLINNTKKNIIKLFPYGINTNNIFDNTSELNNIIDYLRLNISKITLNKQRNQLDNMNEIVYKNNNDISNKFRNFLTEVLGNKNYLTDDIQSKYQILISELNHINELREEFEYIKIITKKIFDSGAIIWSNKLRTEISDSINDILTPSNWIDSWQWKRKLTYLKSISGRERSKIILHDRVKKEQELSKQFTELIKINTNLGLLKNITDLVKSSLSKFQDAIRKIGKGTGKRAPRFKRDAQNAMKSCYGGIPCWIMPLWRISETLPSDFDMFDLVIIDEASQSDIKSITAIMRAKKVLIVGDDKQVSPSVIGIKEDTLQQLKHNYLREQPNASQLLPGSSIYDLARVIFPSQHIMLTEHFRCVEPIIRFSMNFYTEELIPLRIPKSSERLDPPLIDVYVQGGIREKNYINYSEVDAIVEEIKIITSNIQYKDRTIGVVSLIGAKQAYEIQNRLLSELGEEVYTKFKIFCGDASNFQGKEKDIIFLSMVVGEGQGMPMTKIDYEQRFNVALSRARDRMYLYRSIEESDLNNSNDLKLKVLQHFKNPMPNSNNITDGLELCDSDFERDVYKRLDSLGYKVIPQVSVGAYSIDLVVEGEHDKRLAIELDGDRYHTPENWLNDWNRQRVLERVGWIFWRCWGSDYLLDPNSCIEDLINRLNLLNIYPTNNKEINNIYVEHRVYNITNNSSTKNNNIDFDFEEDNEDITTTTCLTDKVVDIKVKSEPISIIIDNKKSLFDNTLNNEINIIYNSSSLITGIKDSELKQLLINLRDNEISKEFVIDRRCILSPLMIEQFIKYKPRDRDEFQNKISLRVRQSIDPEQMSFIDDIFEILEMADE